MADIEARERGRVASEEGGGRLKRSSLLLALVVNELTFCGCVTGAHKMLNHFDKGCKSFTFRVNTRNLFLCVPRCDCFFVFLFFFILFTLFFFNREVESY